MPKEKNNIPTGLCWKEKRTEFEWIFPLGLPKNSLVAASLSIRMIDSPGPLNP